MRVILTLTLIILCACSSETDNASCIYNPNLTTNSASNITETSAALSGMIFTESQNCDVAPGAQQGFVYAAQPMPTTSDFAVNTYGESLSTTINNLTPETTYYVRTFLANSIGEWYGNEVSFTTAEAVEINYGISEYDITFQGLDRNYIVYVPESYSPQTPSSVVFAFHGFGGQNFLTMENTNFNQIADINNFIVVYPQGTLYGISPHWNVGGFTSGSTVDDVAFIDHLITTLSSTYNINPDRVYATGMSNGGFLSFLLACQLSPKIAAVASVTGSMTTETFQNCTPTREVPILQIHGTSDIIVPYNGIQLWNTPIGDVLNYWVANNQCSNTPTINALQDVDPNNGITIEEWIYGNGTNGAIVKHFKVIGGGHSWFLNDDLNASQAVWTFFSNFDRNGIIN